MKFIDVDPSEINNIRQGRRGRISYPLLKSFLETNKFLVKVDITGIQQTVVSLYSSLNTYIHNHEMPIKAFSRDGSIFLMRLDVDQEGKAISNWKELQRKGGFGEEENEDEESLTPVVIEKQLGPEKNKVTK